MSAVCKSENFSARMNVEDEQEEELRLVLIGRTGSGKSASGNTILGRHCFLSDLRASSVTQVCQLGITQLCDDDDDGFSCKRKKLLVVDMPGFGDTHSDPEQIHTEIAKCVALTAPGPHAFLMVMQLGRYTEDEDRVAREMLRMFGESALRHHTVVVFTRGDDLETSGGDLESFLGRDAPPALTGLLQRCGGRCHILNNRKPDDRRQVRELIKKVERMVDGNGGRYYTSSMFQEAELAIQEEQKRLMTFSKKRRMDWDGAEEEWVQETNERAWAGGWGLIKEGWQKWKNRGRRKSLFRTFRTEAALSVKVLNRVKVLVASGATGLAVGAVCGAVAPIALAAGASVVGSSVGLAAGVAGKTAMAVGAAMGGVVGGANGVMVGAGAVEPREAAIETLEQVGMVGAAVLGGAAFLGVGAGLVGTAVEGGAVASAALTGAEVAGVVNTAAVAVPQGVGAAVVDAVALTGGGHMGQILTAVTEIGKAAAGVAIAGGLAVKVVKEKVRSAAGYTEKKSYEIFWNK